MPFSKNASMSNKFFQPGGRRAEKVNDLFATIAPRYDLINDLQSFGLHRWWKRKLIKLAQVQPGEKALDLCCGTGDVSFALARAGAEVTGLDFSAPMLAVATKRSLNTQHSTLNIPAIRFLQGDAQDTPFPDQHFDIVTISYGLRNLASFDAGMREMWRVAKPGGRLLVLDFGKPDNGAWRSLYFAYLRWFVPVFGRIFCGDSETHAYILESLKNYPAQRGVASKMKELGCRDPQIHNLFGGMMSINVGVRPLDS
ncbi:MAG: bifunctional demethylmenaquinone methyltransferase/2-methoxy-6-polyprenyl-1,4-benzoquinol methylase UbiE [Opitutaceae bacterium]|nr:bifunctional demethylmenaquinone methyltransferase/2-methoxy-6-polyprenyl-1,4-benzoquinol methylase UbiE [Verrucomicrobiales bacterium]